MMPSHDRFLEVAAAHLMLKVGPALESGYEQSSAIVLGLMLTTLREEFERAAARRVEENDALRDLFAEAAPAVEDAELRSRLEEDAASREASFAVSELEQSNARLRSRLIELHAYVETLGGSDARRIEDAIWRELVASTERRKLAMGTF